MITSGAAAAEPSALRVIGRILGFARPYKRRLALAALTLVGSGGFAIAMPRLIGWAIDTGLGVRVADGVTSVEVNVTLLLVAGAAILGAAVLRGMAQLAQSYLTEWVAQTVAYDIRNRLYARLQSLSFAFHDRAETGQIMSRATQDVEVLRMFINLGGFRLLYTLLLVVVVHALMFATDWRLALIVLGFTAVVAFRANQVSRRTRRIMLDVQEAQARMGNVLQESLTGIRVVKAFSREDFESRKFRRAADWLYDRSLAASRVQAVHGPSMSALWMAALVVVIWLGGVQVVHGTMTLGSLSAFLLYLNLLQMPARSLGWIVTMFPRAVASGGRVFELLDQESAIQERPGATALPHPRGEIRLDHVSFGYDGGPGVLRDVSFTAESGQVIALLGPTGSGKTTIVNLIPRFYDVTAGAVRFDGVDVRDLTLDALRQQIAVVQQDVFLFSATIRDNLAYGRPDATPDEVEAAARVARIHDFIVSLPQGYDTWVGERGVTLSGGQKQRVAIARALLMNPRVLIFDDSTSSVDTRTEYHIQHALTALMRGRTTFVIAHRLRTVREADVILVLEEGRIVQHGAHAELLAQDGLYRRIYDLELRDQDQAYSQSAAAVAGGD